MNRICERRMEGGFHSREIAFSNDFHCCSDTEPLVCAVVSDSEFVGSKFNVKASGSSWVKVCILWVMVIV